MERMSANAKASAFAMEFDELGMEVFSGFDE